MKIEITKSNCEQAIRENWLGEATEVDVRDCPALAAINAPNAAKVDVGYCPALTVVHAPNAVEVDVRDCPNLKMEAK